MLPISSTYRKDSEESTKKKSTNNNNYRELKQCKYELLPISSTYRKDSEESTKKKSTQHSPPVRTQTIEVGHFSSVDTEI